MSQTPSASTGKRYGVRRVCALWRIARSSYYHWSKRRETSGTKEVPAPAKPGPKTAHSDEEIVETMREIIVQRETHDGIRGEGHRKIWAQLAARGYQVGRKRVLRLMRLNGLLAPARTQRPRGPQVHDGKIVTERPEEMWGTDGTLTWTRQDGNAWIFAAVDHCVGDCVGIHAVKEGTRFAALEPVRQGLHEHFGPPDEGVARGLALRHDCGPQYISHEFQEELDFWGIEASPTFAYSPESNGVVERFFRTLKEQLLWVETFDTVEELEAAVHEFRERFNRSWLYQRHGYRTPHQVRQELTTGLLEAA